MLQRLDELSGMRRIGRSHARWPGFVGRSPYWFVPTISTVRAGEPPAECFDRLPPRQLALRRESWRYFQMPPVEFPGCLPAFRP
jgi:hypothetical protein